MPDSQEDRPTYTQRQFFREAVVKHDKVQALDEINTQTYRVDRTGDLGEVVVYITNLYSVGYADVIGISSSCPDVNCIVTMSNWNGYTGDAKMHASENKIGLFMFAEFMGALNFKQIWKYKKKDDRPGQTSRYK
jgi:hypothetical protein